MFIRCWGINIEDDNEDALVFGDAVVFESFGNENIHNNIECPMMLKVK